MPKVDLNEILDELNQQIADRRLAGDYPVGLEQQLETEFQAMMKAVARNEIDTSELERRIADVDTATHSVAVGADASSRVPGGGAVHSGVARLTQRQTGPIAESVRGFGHTVVAALTETQRLIDAQRTADERQFQDVLSGVLDRLAVLDHLTEIARDLEDRVAALERSATES